MMGLRFDCHLRDDIPSDETNWGVWNASERIVDEPAGQFFFHPFILFLSVFSCVCVFPCLIETRVDIIQ